MPLPTMVIAFPMMTVTMATMTMIMIATMTTTMVLIMIPFLMVARPSQQWRGLHEGGNGYEGNGWQCEGDMVHVDGYAGNRHCYDHGDGAKYATNCIAPVTTRMAKARFTTLIFTDDTLETLAMPMTTMLVYMKMLVAMVTMVMPMLMPTMVQHVITTLMRC